MSEPTGSTAHRVIKNTGFLYAKMGITMFISLYTTRLILNSLGASDFGIFNIVGGAIAMLGFLNAAMAGATQRFMSYSEGEGNKEKQKSIFNISVILHIIIALLMAVVLVIAGYFFFHGILNIAPERIYAAKVVYASLIISTVFTVMTVPYDAVLNAHENMLYYSIVGIIESLLKLAVALLVVAYVGDKLVLYGILMALIPLITITIMRIYCHRKYEECIIQPRRYYNKELIKEMTRFAGWSFLGSSSSMASQYGQGLVINYFFGTKINAAQGIANQISGQLGVFSAVLMKALNPIITKNEGASNNLALKEVVFTGSKSIFYLRLIIYVPFFILMDKIFGIWLTNVPAYAVHFGRLLLIRDLVEHPLSPFNTAINAVGKIKTIQILSSIIYLLPVIISTILFMNGFGPEYIYYVFIFSMSLNASISIYFFIKHCNSQLKEISKNVLLPMLIVSSNTTISYITIWVFSKNIYICTIACFFVMIFSIWKWGLIETEKNYLYGVIRKKRSI
jgi:O-antigen/teichoic acid export membrane protein